MNTRIFKTLSVLAAVTLGCGFAQADSGVALTFPYKEPLPYDEALEYIESDGQTYIDTGLVLTSAMTVEIDCELQADVSIATGIFGARQAASERNISFAVDALAFFADFNNGSVDTYRAMSFNKQDIRTVVTLSAAMRRYVNAVTGAKIAINGAEWKGDFETPSSAYIFAINGTTWPKVNKMRLYGLKIWESGTLIRDYRPCRGAGVVRLYETCTRTFPAIVGEGAFAGGAAVPPQESDFCRTLTQTNLVLEANVTALGTGASSCTLTPVWRFNKTPDLTLLPYLDSDGTHYLDTGLKLNSEMTIVTDFELLKIENGSAGLFGARTSVDELNIAASINRQYSYQSSIDFVTGGNYDRYRSTLQGASAIVTGCRYRIRDSKSVRFLAKVTDSEITYVHSNDRAWDGGFFETAESAHIFHTAGTTWGASHLRLYSFVIYQGKTLVRDYRPAQIGAQKGLYDTVSRAFLSYGETDGAAEYTKTLTVTGQPVRVTGVGVVQVPFAPLRPGTPCGLRLLADNGVAPVTETSEITITTRADSYPDDRGQMLQLFLPAMDRPRPYVDFRVLRKDASAVQAVRLYYGPTYAGTNATAWARSKVIGSFAAAESDKTFRVSGLPKSAVYFRVALDSGEAPVDWSDSIIRHELDLLPNGLIISVE